jgi:hypothetical protein
MKVAVLCSFEKTFCMRTSFAGIFNIILTGVVAGFI